MKIHARSETKIQVYIKEGLHALVVRFKHKNPARAAALSFIEDDWMVGFHTPTIQYSGTMACRVPSGEQGCLRMVLEAFRRCLSMRTSISGPATVRDSN